MTLSITITEFVFISVRDDYFSTWTARTLSTAASLSHQMVQNLLVPALAAPDQADIQDINDRVMRILRTFENNAYAAGFRARATPTPYSTVAERYIY